MNGKLMGHITETFHKIDDCMESMIMLHEKLSKIIAELINKKAAEDDQVTAHFFMEKL